MREFKFRAWDGTGMFPVDTIEFPMGGTRWYGPGVGRGTVYANPDFDWKVDSVLMQYTGLKDRDGKEIYEGDIVKLDSWEGVQQIVFIEGAFCLADKHGWYVGDIHYINHADKNQATIIGNIWENPELLKEGTA